MIDAQHIRGTEDRPDINVRIAAYPKPGLRPEAPEVIEVSASNPRSATTKITNLVLSRLEQMGGGVPEASVREVVENLLHADYAGVVISVLDGGNTVRVSDRGPGIKDKSRALEFGFSGATAEAMREIRGVGAGLGLALAEAKKVDGTLTVEDNIGGGTVVTISSDRTRSGEEPEVAAEPKPTGRTYPDGVPNINISERQQKTLITVLECGEVGPSTIADRVEVSVSTAYRDLSVLEDHGLVIGDESGKRMISPLGRDYVEAIVSTWVR